MTRVQPNAIWASSPPGAAQKGCLGINLALLGGIPLIAHTIRAALAASGLAHSLVSTDDMAIACVAREYGLDVVERPAELATDESSVHDVLRHALAVAETRMPRFDAVVLLQPTSPFRTERHIVAALGQFEEAAADTLTTVCLSREHPWYQLRVEQGVLVPFFGWQAMGALRHTLPDAYIENGAVYVFDRAVLEEGRAYGERVATLCMEPWDSVDIDTEQDLLFARFMLASRESKA